MPQADSSMAAGGPHADFSILRYAQCWEDAEVLLAGLDVQPGDVCLSIGSGGENSFSLLTRDPSRIIAIDLSFAQIACLELKVAAYRHLKHTELLELIGASPSTRRSELYERLRDDLSPATRDYWDAYADEIVIGIGAAGKFEHYFSLFRRYLLPLIHTRHEREALFESRPPGARRQFFDSVWNNHRWRLLFRLFFSRTLMGKLGRDPSFFKYVQGSVAGRIMQQVEHALTELDPAENSYLQWIIFGTYSKALPHALREENFSLIRQRLDRIEWRQASIEQVLSEFPEGAIDRFNLSDIFEYLSNDESDAVFDLIARVGHSGGRIAYWNMLAPRRSPAFLSHRLKLLEPLSRQLHFQARTCFYSAFNVEEFI